MRDRHGLTPLRSLRMPIVPPLLVLGVMLLGALVAAAAIQEKRKEAVAPVRRTTDPRVPVRSAEGQGRRSYVSRTPAGAGFVATLGSAVATPRHRLRDDDDDEERQERLALGNRTFQENCLICHAEVLVERQRLTPAQWKSTVEKMSGWGAPVPPDQTRDLIDFLAAEYPSDKPSATLSRMKPADVLASVQVQSPDPIPVSDLEAGSAAYVMHCATCHGPTGEGADLGPRLVERTVLLQKAEFEQVVREGRRRMPGYRAVLKPADEANILAWLRTRQAALAP